MKMYDRYLGIILLTVFVIESRGQIGQFVPLPDGKECPASSAEWRKQANARNCPGNAPYHCVADQHRQFGEVCVKESWVQPGFCPEYNTEAKKINVKKCQPFDGYICSTDAFQSHETYSHEICLRTPKPTTTTAVPLVTTTAAPSSSPVGPIVAVLLILAVIAVAFLVWFFYLRRRYDLQIPIPFTKRTITICRKKSSEDSDPESKPLVETKDQTSAKTEKGIQRSNPWFVETDFYRDIISTLEKNNVVLVVGKTGIGKSATCIGVLEYYRDRLEWKTKHLPTETVEKLEEKTIVLFDIPFGDIPLYSKYDPNIDKMLNTLYTSLKGGKDGEFKVLITSSSPLTSEKGIPILKGCAELNFDNIQYDKDLKDLYERYTKKHFNIENETDGKSGSNEQISETVMSNNDEQQNNVMEEQPDVKVDVDSSTDHRLDKTSSNLSDSQRSRQSDTGDSNARNVKQAVDESVEENDHKEESTCIKMKSQQENNVDIEDVPRKEKIEATDTRGTAPSEICTDSHPPIQEIGDVNHSKNNTATLLSDVSIELQQQKQVTDEDNNGKKNQLEKVAETWKIKAHISEFGLPAVCYIHSDFQREKQSDKTVDVMSYLDSHVLGLMNSDNKWEKHRYSTLVYMMLNGSTVWSGSIVKQLLGEIDPSLDPERLLVCATEMVDEGMLQKRSKEHLFSDAAKIPNRLSTFPTKSLKDGIMKVTENVFSFSNDLLLFVVIKSYAVRNIQMFITYSYLPFIMQFLQPNEQPDCGSLQLKGDSAFLVEVGTGYAKRNIKKDELNDLAFLKEFKTKLDYHEEETKRYYKIDKEKMDERKGNTYVRKMINHHPYLKEYYAYAEPEKFRSIPKDGFKDVVKDHPKCCQNRTSDDF